MKSNILILIVLVVSPICFSQSSEPSALIDANILGDPNVFLAKCIAKAQIRAARRSCIVSVTDE